MNTTIKESMVLIMLTLPFPYLLERHTVPFTVKPIEKTDLTKGKMSLHFSGVESHPVKIVFPNLLFVFLKEE